MFTGFFLEFDLVPRPCVQPVRDPLGPERHGVEIREIPSQLRGLRARLIARGLDSTSSIVGGWPLSFVSC